MTRDIGQDRAKATKCSFRILVFLIFLAIAILNTACSTNPIWSSYLNPDEEDGISRELLLLALLGGSASQTQATPLAIDAVSVGGGPNPQAYLNDGVGGFTSQDAAASGSSCTDIAIDDLNGDGFNDLFVVMWANPIWTLVNDGAATFTQNILAGTNYMAQGVALADLNNDNYIDAVIAVAGNDRNRVCTNDGTGAFVCANVNAVAGRTSRDVAIVDVDGDSDLDLLFSNEGTLSRVYYNDGSGSFPTFADADSQVIQGKGIAAADLDGNGSIDAFVVEIGGSGHRVLINDGAGNFSGQYECGSDAARGVELADLDGDGDQDAFLARSGSNPNQYCLNNGNGTFTGPFAAGAASNGAAEVVLADFDNDGDVDAISCSGQDYFYTNDGSANFTTTAVGPSQSCDGIFAGDLDSQ